MILNGFKSFNVENLRSLSQRTSKLIAVKIGVLKKKFAASAILLKLCASAIDLGSSSYGIELFSKFEGQTLCSSLTEIPQILSIKRSKPLFNCAKIPGD